MDLEVFKKYCLSFKNVTEHFPFDKEHIVFKVYDKMFALTNVMLFESINLKCDPEQAILLREKYAFVMPGFHMNKKHWNTVLLHDGVDDKQLKTWILNSYNLALIGVTKNKRIND